MGFALLVMQMVSSKTNYIIVGLMILVSSLGVAIDYFGHFQRTFLYPIQIHRSAIYMALGVFLFIGMFFNLSRISLRKVSFLGSMMLVMGLYQAAMRLIHEGPMPATETAVFFLVTLLPLLLVAPSMLRTWEDFNAMLRLMVIVGVVWTAASMVQFVINPRVIVSGRAFRFVGLLGNPQHAATMLAPLATVTLWLLLYDTKKRYKPFMLVSFGVFMVLAMWTGSRTGIGMFGLGAAAVMYSRMGKAVLLLPLGLLAVYVMYKVATLLGIDLGADRLVSTQNTRSGAWEILFDNARANLLFGAGAGKDGAGESESSYLYAVAAYGVGMGALVLVLMITCGIQSLRLLRVKSLMPPSHKTLPDMMIGYFAMYLGGSVFEGIMLARVSAPLIDMVIFSCMATCIIQKARTGDPALYDPEPEDDYGAYEHEYATGDNEDDGYDEDEYDSQYDDEPPTGLADGGGWESDVEPSPG